MNQSPLDKGITYAEQAAAADNAGDLERALHLYLLCLECLIVAHRYAPPVAQKHIEKAMEPRFKRAEDLKAQLGSDVDTSNGTKPAKMTIESARDDGELRASLAGAVLSERPKTRLDDVAGLSDVKQALKEAVLVPMQAPHLFDGKVTPWRGILLYGPPGTGKTFIARAIAGEAGCAFFTVSASDLINKYVGQSERLVRTLFEMAREAKPSVIFIDEIESIVPQRGGGADSSSNHMDRVVTEFLKQVDGLGVDNTGILTLAATNIPWQIDKAGLRRFDRRIYVPLPDAEARTKMLAPELLKAGATADQMVEMVGATEGYSGSDIAIVLREGGMRCLRRVLDATHFCPSPTEKGAYVPCSENAPGALSCSYMEWQNKKELRCPVSTAQDYLDALQVVQPSVKREGLAQFDEWATTK